MKYFITLICLISIYSMAIAQVAIGKETVDGDGILDFENPTNKGISIPKITNLDMGTVPGTFFFDTSDSKVKFQLEGSIMDLTVRGVPANTSYDLSINGYQGYEEVGDEKGTVIGDHSTTVVGSLILEANDKALILPKMENPHLTIKDPEPGMLAYDTVKKMMCVYNGHEWSFWGEQ